MLASCDKAEEITVDDGSIRFVMQHPSATRATETSFEQGDKIGLYLTEYTGETPAPPADLWQLGQQRGRNPRWGGLGDGQEDLLERQSYGRLRLLSLHESGFH